MKSSGNDSVALSTRKIAIVSAPCLNNAGMLSVDYAALEFFENLGLANIPDIYVAQPTPYLKPLILIPRFAKYTIKPSSIRFAGTQRARLLRSNSQLSAYDVIIFWGDFINNPAFGLGDFSGRDVRWGYSRTRAEAFSRWRSLFCGNGLGDRLLISAGNNFQNNFDKVEHQEALRDIFDNFSFIFPRDEYSTEKLLSLRADASKTVVECGMDMAFLQRGRTSQPQNSFSYFFFRSKLVGMEKLIAQISKTTNLNGRELKGWLSLPNLSLDRTFQRLRQQISESRFVITDTYHVAVNSMNLGVPVFCIGRPVEAQNGTVGDFKKKELFRMLGLKKMYFESKDTESDITVVERLPTAILPHVQNSFAAFAVPYKQIAQRSSAFEHRIIEVLYNSVQRNR